MKAGADLGARSRAVATCDRRASPSRWRSTGSARLSEGPLVDILADSAKLVVGRSLASDHEVSGRVELTVLTEVPVFLPDLIIFPFETSAIFHDRPLDHAEARASRARTPQCDIVARA